MAATSNNFSKTSQFPDLEKYGYRDLSPNIGGTFATSTQLRSILESESELRQLAILISTKCVVIFRDQDISVTELKKLAQGLGRTSGKPTSSGLHKHTFGNDPKDHVAEDESGTVIAITPTRNQKLLTNRVKMRSLIPGSHGWHSDAFYENVPADYTVLYMQDVPAGGGDTLWASGYEMYDRMSKRWQGMLDGTTAQKQYGVAGSHQTNRGSPENSNSVLQATQPTIRTNPITGWKSVFAAANTIENGWINDLTPYENNIVKEYLLKILTHNSDIQVRHQWSTNDVAIWDNRCSFHRVNNDYLGKRVALRAVGIGEKPYYDPESRSRREDLGLGFNIVKSSL